MSVLLAIPLVVAFCRGSALARRPLRGYVSLIALVGTIGVALLLPYGFAVHNGVPASRIWLADDHRRTAIQVGRLQAAEEGLSSGLAYYRALAAVNGDQSKVKAHAPTDRDGFFLKLPRYWAYDPSQVGIKWYGGVNMPPNSEDDQESATLRPAMNDWLKRGPALLPEISRQIGYTRAAHASIDMALARPREYTRVGVFLSGLAGAGVLLGLVILNAASLGVVRRLRRRRTRGPVLA